VSYELTIGTPLSQYLAITSVGVPITYEQLPGIKTPTKLSLVEIGWQICQETPALL
jgi:hypothetical protein